MISIKKLLPVVVAAALLLSACTPATKAVDPGDLVEDVSSSIEIVEDAANSEVAIPVQEGETTEQPDPSKTGDTEVLTDPDSTKTRLENFQAQLTDLTENEYDGLEITASILERKAILPGHSVNVHVSIKNTGDQTITYTMGSSSSEVPDALYVYADGLQTIIPEGNLGPSLMDFRRQQLEPGAELTYVYPIMNVEPNASFDDYTWDAYAAEESKYIGALAGEELTTLFPALVPAAAGTYKGHAVFTYTLGEGDATGSNTGYAQAEFDVAITG